jgi:hypothetical protein
MKDDYWFFLILTRCLIVAITFIADVAEKFLNIGTVNDYTILCSFVLEKKNLIHWC